MEELQDLVDKAPAGSEVVIPPGTYRGNLIIQKSLSLLGKKKVLLDGQGKGSVVSVEASHVTLKGVEIRRSGINLGRENSGIFVSQAPFFHVEDVTISDVLFGIQLQQSSDSKVIRVSLSGYPLDIARRGDILKSWYSPRITVRDSFFEKGRDIVVWYSNNSIIKNNVMKKSRYGIHFMYSHDSLVEDNLLEDNSVGIYMMYGHRMSLYNNQVYRSRGPSGFGMALKECQDFDILGNTLVENRVGLHFDNSPLGGTRPPRVISNQFFYNDVGVNFIGRGRGILMEENDFHDNWVQVSSKGSLKIEALWSSNYWSDYAGVNLQGGGLRAFSLSFKKSL